MACGIEQEMEKIISVLQRMRIYMSLGNCIVQAISECFCQTSAPALQAGNSYCFFREYVFNFVPQSFHRILCCCTCKHSANVRKMNNQYTIGLLGWGELLPQVSVVHLVS